MPLRILLLGCIVAALFVAATQTTAAGELHSEVARGFLTEVRQLIGAEELPAEPLPAGELAWPRLTLLSEPNDRVIRVLRTAEDRRAEGEWADALAAYQVLIDDAVRADFRAADGIYIPVDEYCRRRMLSLPDEAIRIYRTINDAAAEAAYQKALRAKSPALLREVADRYPISSVAHLALKHAADLWLERGEYAAALAGCRLVFSRLRSGARPGFSPAPALVKAGACLHALGLRIEARHVAKFVQSHLATYAADATEWVDAITALPPIARPPASWGTFGGDNSHSRSPQKVALPGRLRWHQQAEEDDGRGSGSKQVARPTPNIAPRMMCEPAAHDGVVYYRTRNSVSARDIISGDEIWEYREVLRDRRGAPLRRFHHYGRGSGSLFVTAAAGKVYANIIHVSYDNHTTSYRYKLVALEAKPGGRKPRIVWERGGGREKDKELKRLSFASAPIVSGGKLFVGAIQTPGDDVYLCAFDAPTGGLLWKTFICSGPANIRYNYRNGNGAAEIPAEKDGVVYFAANTGLAAAVDATTGRTIWKNVYELAAGRATPRFPYRRSFRPNNPPIVANGRMYVLPSGSEFLYAISLSTGRVQWRHPVGGDYYYLLGVKNGGVVLSGIRAAYIGEDGAERWSHQLTDGPLGRGVLAEDFALCPTKDGIELIRLETGRFAGAGRPYASWNEWLTLQKDLEGIVQSGNLLIAGGKLIIAGEDRVQVFDERVRPEELLAKLEKSPQSPTLHAELASYYLWRGKYAAAAREYEIAYKIVEQEGARRRLAKTILGELFAIYMDLGDSHIAAGNPARALASFIQAHGRAPGREAKLEASARMAETHAALGNIAAAVEMLQAMISEYPEDYFHPDGYLFVRARTFAQARLTELLERHGREHYAAYDAKVEEILNHAGDEVGAARRILREYPNTGFLASCLLKIAKHAIRENNYRSAGACLAALLRRRPSAAQSDEARSLLALCLEKQGITTGRSPAAQVSLFTPLDRRWSFAADTGRSCPQFANVPVIGETVQELFYVIMLKNLYCRRARDGSPVWKNTAGWLGVSLQDTRPQDAGTKVLDVLARTPAQAAGMEIGDVIIEFDGAEVPDTPSLIRACGNTPSGTEVKVKVQRREREIVLEAKLGERPVLDQDVTRGDRVHFAGMADVDAPAEETPAPERRAAMVISRDKLIQCLDPATGQLIRKFVVSVGKCDPFRVPRPTPRDGLDLRESKILSLTSETVQTRIMPGQPRPQTLRTPGTAALWDVATGRQVWKRALARNPISDPCIVGDVAVIVEMESERDVYVSFYSLADGSRIASAGAEAMATEPPVMLEPAGGRICTAIGRDILCYNVTGEGEDIGQQIWARHLGGSGPRIFKRLAAAQEHGKELILAATENMAVDLIEAATGRSLWSLAPRGGFVLGRIAADQERVYVCSRPLAGSEAHIDAFSIETGRNAWQVACDGLPFVGDMIVTDSQLVVALNQADPRNLPTGASKVLLLDKVSGETLQEIAFKDKTVHALKVVDGVLIIITQDSVIGFGPREPRA